MRLEQGTDELDQVAARLARELHIDEPLLPRIVQAAVRGLGSSLGDPVVAGPALADKIEDALAYEGRPLSGHLNERALADWRGTVRRALAKAMGGAPGHNPSSRVL